MNNYEKQKRGTTAILRRDSEGEIGKLISLIAVARDSYKADFRRFKAEYEAEKDRIAKNYVRGSDEYKAHSEAAEARYNRQTEKIRSDIGKTLYEALTASEQAVRGRVVNVDRNLLNDLRSIAEAGTLSREEIRSLIDCFGSRNYWCDRFLEKTASDNGINIHHLDVPMIPSVDEQLAVLGELREEVEHMLENYSGSDEYRDEVILSDGRLQVAEQRLTGGLYNQFKSDEVIAHDCLTTIRSAMNVSEQRNRLANILGTADEPIKERILAHIATESWAEPLVEYTGASGVLSEWKDGKAKQLFEADRLYRQAISAGRESGDSALVDQMISGSVNPFFVKRVQRESEGDSHIRSAAREANAKSGEHLFSVADN